MSSFGLAGTILAGLFVGLVLLVVVGFVVVAKSNRSSTPQTVTPSNNSRQTYYGLPLVKWELILFAVTAAVSGLIWWFELTPSNWPWVMIIAVAILAAAAIYGAINDKSEPTGAIWISRGVKGVLVIGALSILVFGTRWSQDPVSQAAFDLRSGEPNYMGFLDSGGIWQRGTGSSRELLRPSDCRPKGTAHQGFDYSSKGTCFSPADGSRMVPISAGNVPIIPSLRPFSTPAEKAAEEAAEQAKIDAEQKRRIEIAKAKQPAPYDPTLEPTPRVIPACGTRWVEVAIPANRTIHLPWNSAAATYEWRDSTTGQWVSRPQGSVDKVRICAKHQNYVDDVMEITWSKV